MAEIATAVPHGGEARGHHLLDLLQGFRFCFAEAGQVVDEALAIRRAGYREKLGENVPVPDEFDERSWLLAAEDTQRGRVIGTMRITPRDAGSFECERYFELPAKLRDRGAIEITRFAIRPEGQGRTAVAPIVSAGLFKLVVEFCFRIQTTWLVIAARPEQARTYRWLGFEPTGLRAPYGALGGAVHELLSAHFPSAVRLDGHPLRRAFFREMSHSQIILPAAVPPLGAWLRESRPMRVATATAGR